MATDKVIDTSPVYHSPLTQLITLSASHWLFILSIQDYICVVYREILKVVGMMLDTIRYTHSMVVDNYGCTTMTIF